MKKRLLLFGIIICLIIVSGDTGREFPFHSYNAGDFYFQSESVTGGAGMKGAPLSDKTIFLSASETWFGRGTEHQLMPLVSGVGSSFDRVSYAEKHEVVTVNITDNDQLNLIAMAPRA